MVRLVIEMAFHGRRSGQTVETYGGWFGGLLIPTAICEQFFLDASAGGDFLCGVMHSAFTE